MKLFDIETSVKVLTTSLILNCFLLLYDPRCVATSGSEVMDKLMDVLLGILDLERPDTHTINNIVIPSVDLIYCYADCLTVHESASSGALVAPAVILLKKLLLSPYETVQTSSRSFCQLNSLFIFHVPSGVFF